MKFSCKNWVMFILAAGFWLCTGWLAVQASSAQAASRDELVRVCMYDIRAFRIFPRTGSFPAMPWNICWIWPNSAAGVIVL